MADETNREEFKMTSEEMERIKHAMKDQEFRKLLLDYANEISDPANKQKYEEEIIALEKQRGQDIRLIKPQSGFVIKTIRLSDQMKTFINIGTSSEIQEFYMDKGTKNGSSGVHIKLPHSSSPHREDLDKGGCPCIVFDVCFHPNSYKRAMEDGRFRDLLIDTSLDAIERQAATSFDKQNKKFPKMKYKGAPHTSIIRRSSDQAQAKQTPTSGSSCANLNETSNDTTESRTFKCVPSYKIIHRGYFDIQDYVNSNDTVNGCSYPKELVVTIDLPLASSAEGIDLDILEKNILLNCIKLGYHLDIPLPYKIDEDKGCAQFDKADHTLKVTLPVLSPERRTVTCTPEPSLVQDVTDLNFACRNVYQSDCTDQELDDVTLDTSTIESLSGTSALPPYNCRQTDENITITLNVSGVKVENLSVGFTSHQVCISFPQLPEDRYSPDWNMLVRTEEKNFLNADECGFTIHESSMDVTLQKAVKSKGLWDRFYIGVSELALKLEFFLTETLTDKMMTSLTDGDHANPKQLSGRTAEHLEARLEQLLMEQEKCPVTLTVEDGDIVEQDGDIVEQDGDTVEQHGDIVEQVVDITPDAPQNTPITMQSASSYNEHSTVMTEQSSEGQSDDDLSVMVNLLDLQDDVIDSADVSPCDALRFTTKRVFERSTSHDPTQRRRLKSILKRTKSDSATCDTDDELRYDRMRAVTVSDDYLYKPPDGKHVRRRYKSVTFIEQPTVFEFDKLSKKQWKKKVKEGRQRDAMEKKVQEMVAIQQSTTVVSKPEAGSQKHGKKWRKAEKKRLRQNSGSRSEEDAEVDLTSKKTRKKKKKSKKKNPHIDCGGLETDYSKSEDADNLTLSNPLIYELE